MSNWVEMKDRFDFEQCLLDCWKVTDDIKLLSKNVLEGKTDGTEMTTDDISNYLFGLEHIYNTKFDALWYGFENVIMDVVRNVKSLEQECSALRTQLVEMQKGKK